VQNDDDALHKIAVAVSTMNCPDEPFARRLAFELSQSAAEDALICVPSLCLPSLLKVFEICSALVDTAYALKAHLDLADD